MAKNKTSFTTGNSGRKRGSKNRATPEIRNFIQQVVDNNLHRLEEDLDRMSPATRWQTIERLMKYFIPTLTKNDNQNTNAGEVKITIDYIDTPLPTDTTTQPIYN